jgi:predicted HTH transcriptional regulator
MSYKAAAETIIARYVQATIATTPEIIARVLLLEPDRIAKIAASLVEQGKLRQIEDGGKTWLVSDTF